MNRAILEAAERLMEAKVPGVLAQLVSVSGPSYRPVGSVMVGAVGMDCVGGVSGGCLEDYVVREGLRVTEGIEGGMGAGGAVLSFDTTHDPEDPKPVPGCGGKLHVAVERVSEAGVRWLAEVVSRLERDEVVGVETVVEGWEPGRTTISRRVMAGASELATEQASWEGGWRLVQRVEPVVRLVVIGAGDDGVALARQGRLLGWEVMVLDRRARLAREDRFPPGVKVRTGRWEDMLGSVRVSARTAVVVMTHSIPDDAEVLPWALGLEEAGFVGLLGPVSRREVVLREVERRGERVLPDGLERLRSPVGLDLGEKSPEAIALAVAAEIVATRHGRRGGMLSRGTVAVSAGTVSAGREA